MNTYSFKIELELTIEAPNSSDAVEVLNDYLGDVDYGSISVEKFKILDIHEV